MQASVRFDRDRLAIVALALLCCAALLPSAAQASAPANDDVGTATAIGSLPFNDTLDASDATGEPFDPDPANCVFAQQSVWYTFTPTADGLVSADTFGSDYDTLLTIYTGTPEALSRFACNDDFLPGVSFQSRVTFDATAGQTYYLLVAASGSEAAGMLALNMRDGDSAPPPPNGVTFSIDPEGTVDHDGIAVITGSVRCTQDQPLTVVISLAQSFQGQQAGGEWTGPLMCKVPSVRWTRTVVPFPSGPVFGAGLAPASGMAYACDGGTCGFVEQSTVVRLRRIQALQPVVPANDEIASAKAISSLPYSDSIDATEATSGDGDPGCVGNGHSVWYTFTPDADRKVVADTFGSDYDTSLSVYSGTPGALSQVACNDDTDGAQSQVTFNATSGQTYYIMVASFLFFPAGATTLTLAEDPSPLPPPPPPPLVQIGVSVDSAGSVRADGTATISGIMTCAEADEVRLDVFLTQTVAGRLQIHASRLEPRTCTPPSTRWTMPLKVESDIPAALRPGQTQVRVIARGCNSVICGGDEDVAVVRLNRGR